MPNLIKHAGVVPASLSFLTIYNPSLSDSDETLHDQITYYYSKLDKTRSSRKFKNNAEDGDTREERNERLRQIGLAQGMVEFAKSFSNGEAVDSIESEKSRIILHELEKNWWILASVDLTRIATSPEKSAALQASGKDGATIEYSAREVCPPSLLLQQILRAHCVFLLHHSPTIAELYTRLSRPKFCGVLKTFWDKFVWNWDVLLHGNPAVDIFNGLKLAAGGELGIGVGEEEWGSGEREVLEGFIERTDGLVDLVVSRFGSAPPAEDGADEKTKSTDISRLQEIPNDWQGAAQDPRPSDGVIFSGVGAIKRSSIRDISAWVEMLYKYGHDAYGIQDNPATFRRKRPKIPSLANRPSSDTANEHPQQGNAQIRRYTAEDVSGENRKKKETPIGIPPPVVSLQNPQAIKSTTYAPPRDKPKPQNKSERDESGADGQPASGTETLMKYLTLGVYGYQWGIPLKRSPSQAQDSTQDRHDANAKGLPKVAHKPSSSAEQELSHGYFMIGLQGDLEQDSIAEDESAADAGTDPDNVNDTPSSNNRTMRRMVYVERNPVKTTEPRQTSSDDHNNTVAEAYHDRLRVVVYVQQPFIFTFLFELHADSLSLPSFYRSLHYQLGPLQRPLLKSTSPSKVSERLWEAATPKSTASTNSSQPICDLVYDPFNLTVHTTIPNIPEPGLGGDEVAAAPWTRIEALTVHSQILNTYTSTRRHAAELERTCKTSRGWWVVWMRLPPPVMLRPWQSNMFREAFLIRKASDYVAPVATKSMGRFGRNVSASSSSSSGWGAGKLAEGIGIDARQYIEGLLSLNR